MNKRILLCHLSIIVSFSFLSTYLGARNDNPDVVMLENRAVPLAVSVPSTSFWVGSAAGLAAGAALTRPDKACLFKNYKAPQVHDITISVPPLGQHPTVTAIPKQYSWFGRLTRDLPAAVPFLARLGATAALTYGVGKLTHHIYHAKDIATQAVAFAQQEVNNLAILVTLRNATQKKLHDLASDDVIEALTDHALFEKLDVLIKECQDHIDVTLRRLSDCAYGIFSEDASQVLVSLKDDMELINESYMLGRPDLFDAAYEYKNAMELMTRLEMLGEQQQQEADLDVQLETAWQCNDILLAVINICTQELQSAQPTVENVVRWSSWVSPVIDMVELFKITPMIVKGYCSSWLERESEEQEADELA